MNLHVIEAVSDLGKENGKNRQKMIKQSSGAEPGIIVCLAPMTLERFQIFFAFLSVFLPLFLPPSSRLALSIPGWP